MNFYKKQHNYYCGIDLHAKSLYVCIISHNNEKLLHKEIPANTESLMDLLKPFLNEIIIGAESMLCWYWLSNFCDKNNIEFVLGHPTYMRAIQSGKTKNDRIDSYKIAHILKAGSFPLAYKSPENIRHTRDLLRRRSKFVKNNAELKSHIKNTAHQYNLILPQLNLSLIKDRGQVKDFFKDSPLSVQHSIEVDLNMIKSQSIEIRRIELHIEQQITIDNPESYNLLKAVPGIGNILSFTIIYEVGEINRFSSVQQFSSYARLIKCKSESAEKSYGTRGNKIGNKNLKWALSQAAQFYSQASPQAKNYLSKLKKKHSLSKALTIFTHKFSRCIFYMLKNNSEFNEEKLLGL